MPPMRPDSFSLYLKIMPIWDSKMANALKSVLLLDLLARPLLFYAKIQMNRIEDESSRGTSPRKGVDSKQGRLEKKSTDV